MITKNKTNRQRLFDVKEIPEFQGLKRFKS